jgi:pectin-derived oligosaccharide transport system permease protein
MSEQLVTCLISVATNLAGIMIIYCIMAQALVGLAWRGRGIFGVIATIIVAQLIWLAPALLIAENRQSDNASLYGLWFGNWLVSGFSVVLLWRTARRIPRALEDSARLDGLGAFDIWRHIVFPFAKRDLLLIAIFTVVATLLPYWSFVTLPETGSAIVLYQRATTPTERILFITAVSLIGALPLIAIFFLGRRPITQIESTDS